MNSKILFFLIKSYIPGLSLIKRFKRRKLVNSYDRAARYCYSVWLRHLSLLEMHGLNTDPKICAELGPGSSIGVGLMSLLTGAEKYYAFDVERAITLKDNISLLDKLIDLLFKRADIPNQKEFPHLNPELRSYNFPNHILRDERIKNSLIEKKSMIIKKILNNEVASNQKLLSIDYFCPWYDSKVISDTSVDMIFSQAVLEHVDDLENTYKAMSRWLKKGGIMSHQIDFKSHGTSEFWNGHWKYSALKWKVLKGRRKFLINRAPLSKHIELHEKNGFKIISVIRVNTYPDKIYKGAINRNHLAPEFQNISEEDLNATHAHILSQKN